MPSSPNSGNDQTRHAAARSRPDGVFSAAARRRRARPGWLIALAAVTGALCIAVLGLLAFRLARTFAAKRPEQGVAIAQHRSGETPAVDPQFKSIARGRSPEAWLPALPTPLPDAGPAGAVVAPARASANPAVPVVPPGRFVIEDSDSPSPKRGANHLFVDTQPRGAQVWIDGTMKGNTPLDLPVGAGGKRLVLIAAGYEIVQETFDAREGSIIRVALVPVAGPACGDAFVNVACRTPGRYPIFVDDLATGLLCPAGQMPVSAGSHRVGVFVPAERKLVTVETTAAAGPRPVEVDLDR